MRWLRESLVLLPGVTTLERLVARERDAATLRVWTDLAQPVSGGQARLLRGLLVVPEAARRSELDRLRKAETVTSGAGMVRALRRVSDVSRLGLGALDVSAVPPRRVVALARYGMAAKATALRRHPEPRRLATLVATVRSLEAKAVDDALELFDVLMTNDLLARSRIGGVSAKVLTQTLRRLEANGLVARRSLATAPRGVEYRLTSLGETLLDPVRTLCAWAEANTDALVAAREQHATQTAA